MLDIEALLQAESDEALRELKLFLFKENIRMENERREIAAHKEKLIRERNQFRTEMDMLHHKIVMEQKRLKDDNLFFDKKMQILQDGFRQMDMDRRKLDKERARFIMEKELWERDSSAADMQDIASVLFRGATNPLTLRKRYKDLLKIFHPDNLCGDAELVQMINREYERRKKAE
ncbi:MAG: hypothetical protein UFG06_02235 [Lachnospiraceae bacterium]|nr:hypothetical protein [Lachnospiraceae bacterium]